eukprot:gene5012-8610_t
MEEEGLFVWKKLNFTDQRASHSIVYHKGSLYILFGNSNDSKYFNHYSTMIHKFSMKNNTSLTKITSTTLMFSKHCHYKNSVYFFGGRSFQGQVVTTICLNLDTLKIKEITTNGKEPHERLYHCSTLQNDKFYIFGGETENDIHLNDLHSFDLNTFEWTEIIPVTKLKPEGRRYGSMVSKDNMIYVFGGRHDGYRMNDLWSFNILSEEWSLMKTFGDVPNPMTAFSSVIQGNSIFCFGGNNGNTLNSIFEFYIPTNNWILINVYGSIPMPRYWHSAVLNDNDEMIIHGGYSDTTLNMRDCWKIKLPKRSNDLRNDIDNSRKLNHFCDVIIKNV